MKDAALPPVSSAVAEPVRARACAGAGWISARWRPRSMAVLLVLGLTVLLSPADGFINGVIPWERDTEVFYYPLFEWAWQQIHNGQFPLWLPGVFGGYAVFADGELGLAYPPVLATILAVGADNGFVLLRIIHFGIAMVGGYLLARTWQLPRVPSILVGITITLGSFFPAQIHHENIIRTAAWLPLLLASTEAALRAGGRRRVRLVLVAGVATGFSALGLHAQILAMNLLTVGLYSLLRWGFGAFGGGEHGLWQRGRTAFGVLTGMTAMGLGLGAIQIIPLGELAAFSPRGAGMPYAQAAAYSLTPYGLLQLIFPYVFRTADNHQWGLWTHWESYLYVGLAPLVLAMVGALASRRREVLVWVVLAAVGLLLALGEYSPINLHYLLWLLPGLDGLRAPDRFSLMVIIALAMLAGHGLMLLEARASRSQVVMAGRVLQRSLVGLACGAVVAAALLVVLHAVVLGAPDQTKALIDSQYLSLPHDSYPLSSSDVLVGLTWFTDLTNPRTSGALLGLLALALALLVWQAAPWQRVRRWPGWSAVLTAATVADLLVFGWSVHPREALATLGTPTAGAYAVQGLIAQDAQQDGPSRILTSPAIEQIAPDRLVPLSLQDASGYTSLEAGGHQQYLRRVLSVDDDLLDLWNVRYVLDPATYGPLQSYNGVDFLDGHALLAGPGGGALADERFRVPDGFTIREIRLVSALANAATVPDGTEAGEIRLLDAQQQVLATEPILVGSDTADGQADPPVQDGGSDANRAQDAGDVQDAGPDGQTVTRRLSFGDFTFPDPQQVTMVELRSTIPRGELLIYGAALVDPTGNVQDLFQRQKTKYREVYRDSQIAVLENQDVFPRSFFVPQSELAPASGDLLTWMEDRPFEPSRSVVLPDDAQSQAAAPPAPSPPSSAAQTSGEGALLSPLAEPIQSYGLTQVVIQANEPSDGFLVLSDTYYPGWRAFVDGVEQPLLRGDLLFRVVQVPAGSHRVEFDFDPASLKIGGAISAITALLALLALVLAWPREQERSSRY